MALPQVSSVGRPFLQGSGARAGEQMLLQESHLPVCLARPGFWEARGPACLQSSQLSPLVCGALCAPSPSSGRVGLDASGAADG